MHTYRPGNLRDEILKRSGLWPTPGCNAMEEEEDTTLKANIPLQTVVASIHIDKTKKLKYILEIAVHVETLLICTTLCLLSV
jgi:hypothetical protein